MELPFQQFFLGSIPVSLGKAKPRLQINLGHCKLYCQATGLASRRFLKSTAWLQSLLKLGIQGCPVGTAGCPCQLPIRISSSATLQLPTPSTRRAHRGTEAKSRSQEASIQYRLCLTSVPWAGYFTLLLQMPHLKSVLLRLHVESLLVLTSDSRSIFRALVLRA